MSNYWEQLGVGEDERKASDPEIAYNPRASVPDLETLVRNSEGGTQKEYLYQWLQAQPYHHCFEAFVEATTDAYDAELRADILARDDAEIGRKVRELVEQESLKQIHARANR